MQEGGDLAGAHERDRRHVGVVADGGNRLHSAVHDLEDASRHACLAHQLCDGVGRLGDLLRRLQDDAVGRGYIRPWPRSAAAGQATATYQLPMVRAMGTVHMGTMLGKLKGQIDATMPRGSRTS